MVKYHFFFNQGIVNLNKNCQNWPVSELFQELIYLPLICFIEIKSTMKNLSWSNISFYGYQKNVTPSPNVVHGTL